MPATATRKPMVREARRIPLDKEVKKLERFDKGVPENKKPQIKRILSRLEERHEALKLQVNTLSENLGRYKFNKSVINGLSEMRIKEIQNLKAKGKPYMYENVERKLRDGFKPEQLLAAGYTKEDVTNGWYRTIIYK